MSPPFSVQAKICAGGCRTFVSGGLTTNKVLKNEGQWAGGRGEIKHPAKKMASFLNLLSPWER